MNSIGIDDILVGYEFAGCSVEHFLEEAMKLFPDDKQLEAHCDGLVNATVSAGLFILNGDREGCRECIDHIVTLLNVDYQTINPEAFKTHILNVTCKLIKQ